MSKSPVAASTTSFPYQDRIARFQKKLQLNQAAVIATSSDIRYATGFICLTPHEREALLVITPAECYLFHASFTPVPSGLSNLNVTTIAPYTLASLSKKLVEITESSTHQPGHILVDMKSLYADEYHQLQQNQAFELQPLDQRWLQSQRRRKDENEIAAITAASTIVAKAVAAVTKRLQKGMTEIEVRYLLEDAMRQAGSEAPAFPTIVAFGPHSALPHHQPTDTTLTTNTAILIDCGATVDGYHSDMTRTLWFGDRPNPTFLEIETSVKNAYQAALTCLRQNGGALPTAKEVDDAARDVITQAGYGPQYIHTTGHGVGLDIHEAPSLSWKNDEPLETDMVITIEPGIYLNGKFGYRHENTVVLEEKNIREVTAK